MWMHVSADGPQETKVDVFNAECMDDTVHWPLLHSESRGGWTGYGRELQSQRATRVGWPELGFGGCNALSFKCHGYSGNGWWYFQCLFLVWTRASYFRFPSLHFLMSNLRRVLQNGLLWGLSQKYRKALVEDAKKNPQVYFTFHKHSCIQTSRSLGLCLQPWHVMQEPWWRPATCFQILFGIFFFFLPFLNHWYPDLKVVNSFPHED